MDILLIDAQERDALEWGFKEFLMDAFKQHSSPERHEAMAKLKQNIALNVHDISAMNNPILTDESNGLISLGNFKVLGIERSDDNPETGVFYTFAIQPTRDVKQTAIAVGIIANDAAQVLDERLHFSEPKIEHVIQDFEIGQSSI